MKQFTRQSRAGFTLLELIIAAGLTATLLILVWSLFSVYTKLSAHGNRKATELQLARALVHQIRSDLRQALPQKPPIPFSPVLANSTNSPNQPQSLQPRLSKQTGKPLPDGPVFLGTETSFQFFAWSNRPDVPVSESFTESSSEHMMPHVYDQIVYRWTAPKSQSTPFNTNQSVDGEFPTSPTHSTSRTALGNLDIRSDQEETPAGLIRQVQSWINASLPSQNSGSGAGLGSPVETDQNFRREPEVEALLDAVPEVSQLRFRYSDGRGWKTEWNSLALHRLPAAVEITLEFEDPEVRKEREEQELHDFNQKSARKNEESLPRGERRPHTGTESLESSGPTPAGRKIEPIEGYRFIVAMDTLRPTPNTHPGIRP